MWTAKNLAKTSPVGGLARDLWSLTANAVSVDPCCKCIIFGTLWEEVVAGGRRLNCPFVAGFPFWHNHNVTYNRSTLVFTGTYHRTLDQKQRVLMPKRLRSSLVEESGMYLTPGTDRCLELHTDESLRELANRTQQAKTSNQNVRSFSRLFYARASFCEFDKQNRIRIPKESAVWAGLEREIVLVGVGFNWEIWNLPAWEAYLEQNSDSFDGLVNQTFSLNPTVIPDETFIPDETVGGLDPAKETTKPTTEGLKQEGIPSSQKPR